MVQEIHTIKMNQSSSWGSLWSYRNQAYRQHYQRKRFAEYKNTILSFPFLKGNTLIQKISFAIFQNNKLIYFENGAHYWFSSRCFI